MSHESVKQTPDKINNYNSFCFYNIHNSVIGSITSIS